MQLIGLVGKKNTGKHTCSKFIASVFSDVRVISISDPIKKACMAVYNLDEYNMTYGKDHTVPRWNMTPREMVYKLRDSITNQESSDHWIKILAIRLDNFHDHQITHIVIPDVKHQEEADFIRSMGGKLIHISRDSSDDGDIRDVSTEDIECDQYINNCGSIEELKSIISYCVWN